jgi:hypothetical protein
MAISLVSVPCLAPPYFEVACSALALLVQSDSQTGKGWYEPHLAPGERLKDGSTVGNVAAEMLKLNF